MTEYYEGYDEELEALKARKIAEMKRRIQEEEERRPRIDAILKQILTPAARERLYNLRLIKPELARLLEDQLIMLAQNKRIPIPVTDDFLKRLLSELYEQTHRDTKITFKRK